MARRRVPGAESSTSRRSSGESAPRSSSREGPSADGLRHPEPGERRAAAPARCRSSMTRAGSTTGVAPGGMALAACRRLRWSRGHGRTPRRRAPSRRRRRAGGGPGKDRSRELNRPQSYDGLCPGARQETGPDGDGDGRPAGGADAEGGAGAARLHPLRPPRRAHLRGPGGGGHRGRRHPARAGRGTCRGCLRRASPAGSASRW